MSQTSTVVYSIELEELSLFEGFVFIKYGNNVLLFYPYLNCFFFSHVTGKTGKAGLAEEKNIQIFKDWIICM